MKYFRTIGRLDVAPVLDRVAALRLEDSRPGDIVVPGLKHKAVPLRIHAEYKTRPMSFFEDPPVFDHERLKAWPEMQALLASAQAMVAADPVVGPQADADALGRVVFSLIEPQGFIQWHKDAGEYFDATMRFHAALFTTAGAVNYAPEGEALHIDVGELTWLDNRPLHSAINLSDAWRNHLIFEIRCRAN